MKKFILAAAAIFISTGAFAQVPHFEYGVKAGINFAAVTKVINMKTRMGIHAGAFAEYVINEYGGVQAELLYSMQGNKAETAGVTTINKFDYIILPILAKAYVIPEKLSVDLGPQLGCLVSANEKVKGNGTSVSRNIFDNVRKFDVSFGVGMSYKLPLNLDISARYNFGLTEVYGNAKNNVFQFGAGYRF